MPALCKPRHLLTLTLLAVMLLAAVCQPADASTTRVRASGIKNGKIVFKPRGVAAPRLSSARVKTAGRLTRRLQLRSVKRQVRSGSVKVNAPRTLRKRISRIKRKAQAGSISRPQAAQLVAQVQRQVTKDVLELTIQVPPTSSPTDSTSLGGPGSCGAVPANALYVSPSGSDSGSGTVNSPFKTLNAADRAARPGTTIALRGGTIGESGKIAYMQNSGTASAPISIVAYPGETPVIAGQMYLEGANRRVCGLLFDKPTGEVATQTSSSVDHEGPKVFVAGPGIQIEKSEIRGARGAGIYLDGADNVRLIDNYVHDNGRFDTAAHANLDHGIYFSSGSGLVQGNRIEHNVAHAIQIYPNAHNVMVRGNSMSRHGRAAVMLAENASDNTIEDNDIHGNQRGVETWELRGTGNVARNNRLWDNDSGNFAGSNLSLAANTIL